MPPTPPVAYLVLVRSMRIFVAVILFTFSCFPSAARCKPPPDDPAYDAKLDAQAWKRLIEHLVTQQQAGEKLPQGGDLTWKEYWISSYEVIRGSPALPWKGSEFKTAEDMVSYIKHRLKAHGLPTYE